MGDALRVTVLFHDLVNEGPVWRNGYWPLIDLLSQLGPFQLLEAPWPKPRVGSKLLHSVRNRMDQRAAVRKLASEMDQSDTTDALFFAVALSPAMVRMASDTVERMPDDASHKVLYIDENIEPEDVNVHHWQSFDRIVCFCSDLAQIIEKATGVPTSYWAPHLDLLKFHSTSDYRPLDLMCFGRNRTDVLFEMQKRFLDPAKPFLCLDYVTRTQNNRMQTAEAEFRALFDTLSKSQATLCFPPHNEPRFKGRSPLLARWVYAWAAGCTVIGTRPKSAGAQEHMDWPNSMVELPDDVGAACDLIEETLSDKSAMQRQGLVNAKEAVARHDTRYRLRDLFNELGIALPDRLRAEIEELSELSSSLGQ